MYRNVQIVHENHFYTILTIELLKVKRFFFFYTDVQHKNLCRWPFHLNHWKYEYISIIIIFQRFKQLCLKIDINEKLC